VASGDAEAGRVAGTVGDGGAEDSSKLILGCCAKSMAAFIAGGSFFDVIGSVDVKARELEKAKLSRTFWFRNWAA
jgi:hypothetical protein